QGHLEPASNLHSSIAPARRHTQGTFISFRLLDTLTLLVIGTLKRNGRRGVVKACPGLSYTGWRTRRTHRHKNLHRKGVMITRRVRKAPGIPDAGRTRIEPETGHNRLKKEQSLTLSG